MFRSTIYYAAGFLLNSDVHLGGACSNGNRCLTGIFSVVLVHCNGHFTRSVT